MKKLKAAVKTRGRSTLSSESKLPTRGKPATTPKAKRPFKDIFAKYPRYDPTVEGFGSPAQWKEAFEERMGVREARGVLHGQDPRGILGVGKNATWDEIRRAFRKLALEHHPDRAAAADRAAATEKLRELNAAYAILAEEFGQ